MVTLLLVGSLLISSSTFGQEKKCSWWFAKLKFRISLRTLFIGTALTGIGLGVGLPLYWEIGKVRQGVADFKRMAGETQQAASAGKPADVDFAEFKKSIPNLAAMIRSNDDPFMAEATLRSYANENPAYAKKLNSLKPSLREWINSLRSQALPDSTQRRQRAIFDQLYEEALLGTLGKMDASADTGPIYIRAWAMQYSEGTIDLQATGLVDGTVEKGTIKADDYDEVVGEILINQIRQGTASPSTKSVADDMAPAYAGVAGIPLTDGVQLAKWMSDSRKFAGEPSGKVITLALLRGHIRKTLADTLSAEEKEKLVGPVAP